MSDLAVVPPELAPGQQPSEILLEVQERYDTYFLKSDAWRKSRA